MAPDLGGAVSSKQQSFTWPKYCGNCGKPIRKQSWDKYHRIGEMKASPNFPEMEPLELRNCVCGSTMAVPTAATKKSDPPKKK